MTTSKHIWTSAALLAFAAALPATASAQNAPDPHAGHHPAEAAPATPASPAPATPGVKSDGMMGSMMGGGAGMGADGGKMPMMGMMGGGMPMGGDVEARIASLRAELKITRPQTVAWKAFADVLLANAKRAGQLQSGMMKGHDGAPPSLTHKLEMYEHMMLVCLGNLRALKPALVRLYAGLSPEQKTKADRLLAHETGMMPGMQIGEMRMPDMPGGMTKR